MAPRRASPRSLLIGAAILLLTAGAFWVFATLRSASLGLQTATTEVSRDGQFAYQAVSLDHPAATGFEPISSPAQFTDATVYNGKFYLCGPTGLLAFDPNGGLGSVYHPGIELPPAPLVNMAVGVGTSGVGPQLWIATHGEGLLIFDGKSFQQIKPEIAAARSLTAVLPLATGRILLGTEKNGVLAWDGKTLSQLHPTLANLHVTALSGDESDLWIGTIDQGVTHWHAGQLEVFAGAEGLPDARVLSIASASDATYIGTALGVAEFRGGKFTRKIAEGYFAKSLLIHGDSLLVGTLEEGVIELPLKAQRPRLNGDPANDAESPQLKSAERVLALDGHVYVLSEDGLYEKGRRVFSMPGAPLTDRNISALAIDGAGRLWVGYFDRGLDILEKNFERAAHYEDERVFCVNRIVHEDNSGTTAVGTANGLAMFQGGKLRQVLTKSQGLIANTVTDIQFRPTAHELGITIGTPAGLTMIDGSGTTSMYAFHGLVNNHIYALGASDKKLLVGTLGGLSMLEAGVVKASYTTANSGLKQNWITAIQPVGDDWFIGTYGTAVVKLDAAGRWTAFPDLRGQIEINPNAMAATSRAVYAGTLASGLAAYNRASGRWTFITAGLPSPNITAVTAAAGYLYIGTENGLVRIPEQRISIQ